MADEYEEGPAERRVEKLGTELDVEFASLRRQVHALELWTQTSVGLLLVVAVLLTVLLLRTRAG